MKKSLFFLIFLLSLQGVSAQRMRDVFASMPDSVLEVMTKNNRLDCIDFIENNMEARVRNRFDGFSELKTLTKDYLNLNLTSSCLVEMKLLPVADSISYICVVKTYSDLFVKVRWLYIQTNGSCCHVKNGLSGLSITISGRPTIQLPMWISVPCSVSRPCILCRHVCRLIRRD